MKGQRMGNYGNALPVTGVATLTIGGVAVAYPIAAAIVAGLVLAAGLALRITNRRRVKA
jgi:hypothetical protein